jgi:hypothetical protein
VRRELRPFPGYGKVQPGYFCILPLLNNLHDVGMTVVLAANRRRLSLVDCVSFATARQFGVKTVFAFDTHFVEQVSFSGKDKQSEKHCYK